MLSWIPPLVDWFDCQILPLYGPTKIGKSLMKEAAIFEQHLASGATHDALRLRLSIVLALHQQSLERKVRLEEKSRHLSNLALLGLTVLATLAAAKSPDSAKDLGQSIALLSVLCSSVLLALGALWAHSATKVQGWQMPTLQDEIDIADKTFPGIPEAHEDKIRVDRVGWWTKINEVKLVDVVNRVDAAQVSIRNAGLVLFPFFFQLARQAIC